MIKIFNVSASYAGGFALQNINLHIKKGEMVYLTGPSGAGKSTLIRLLYLDIFPQRGHFILSHFNSTKIRRRDLPLLRRQMGIIFQDFRLFDDRSVYENIAFTLAVTATRRKEIHRRVLQVLADVGLSHKRNCLPQELSGGEKQRVAIARALVNEPFILLADEPTGNLDSGVSSEIMKLLGKINGRGMAILMATHNYDLIRQYPGRVLRMENGALRE
jgi:cell division transport system ATP-binding protein